MTDQPARLEAEMKALGLSVRSEFVPFSQSRNKDEKLHTLNWKVTLVRDGRDILTTDYSAGSAHCPGYNRKVPPGFDRPDAMWRGMVTRWECEHGFEAAIYIPHGGGSFMPKREAGKPVTIEPKAADVVQSLISDADVLNYAKFEEWASDLGYDEDSRKAEKIYRACLEIALQLRNGLGDANLATLTEAAQDY